MDQLANPIWHDRNFQLCFVQDRNVEENLSLWNCDRHGVCTIVVFLVYTVTLHSNESYVINNMSVISYGKFCSLGLMEHGFEQYPQLFPAWHHPYRPILSLEDTALDWTIQIVNERTHVTRNKLEWRILDQIRILRWTRLVEEQVPSNQSNQFCSSPSYTLHHLCLVDHRSYSSGLDYKVRAFLVHSYQWSNLETSWST